MSLDHHKVYIHTLSLALYDGGVLAYAFSAKDLLLVKRALQSPETLDQLFQGVDETLDTVDTQKSRRAISARLRALVYEHWTKGSLISASPWVRLSDITRVDDEYVLLGNDRDDWECADQAYWLTQLPEARDNTHGVSTANATTSTTQPTPAPMPAAVSLDASDGTLNIHGGGNPIVGSEARTLTGSVAGSSTVPESGAGAGTGIDSVVGEGGGSAARMHAQGMGVERNTGLSTDTLGPIPSLELLTQPHHFRRRRRRKRAEHDSIGLKGSGNSEPASGSTREKVGISKAGTSESTGVQKTGKTEEDTGVGGIAVTDVDTDRETPAVEATGAQGGAEGIGTNTGLDSDSDADGEEQAVVCRDICDYEDTIFSRQCTLLMALKGEVMAAEEVLRTHDSFYDKLLQILEHLEQSVLDRSFSTCEAFVEAVVEESLRLIREEDVPRAVSEVLDKLQKNLAECVARLRPVRVLSSASKSHCSGTCSAKAETDGKQAAEVDSTSQGRTTEPTTSSDDMWEVSEEVLDQSSNAPIADTVDRLGDTMAISGPVLIPSRRRFMRRESTYRHRMFRMARMQYNKKLAIGDQISLCRRPEAMGLSANEANLYQRAVCAYSDCRHTAPESIASKDSNLPPKHKFYFPEMNLEVRGNLPERFEPKCRYAHITGSGQGRHSVSQSHLTRRSTIGLNGSHGPESLPANTNLDMNLNLNMGMHLNNNLDVDGNINSNPNLDLNLNASLDSLRNDAYSNRRNRATSMANSYGNNGSRFSIDSTSKSFGQNKGTDQADHGTGSTHHSAKPAPRLSQRHVQVLLRRALMLYLTENGFQGTSEGALDRLLDVAHEHLRTLTTTMRVLADQTCSTRHDTRHAPDAESLVVRTQARADTHTPSVYTHGWRGPNGMAHDQRHTRATSDAQVRALIGVHTPQYTHGTGMHRRTGGYKNKGRAKESTTQHRTKCHRSPPRQRARLDGQLRELNDHPRRHYPQQGLSTIAREGMARGRHGSSNVHTHTHTHTHTSSQRRKGSGSNGVEPGRSVTHGEGAGQGGGDKIGLGQSANGNVRKNGRTDEALTPQNRRVDEETLYFLRLAHKAIRVSGSSFAQILQYHYKHIEQRDTLKFLSDNHTLNLGLSSMDTNLHISDGFELMGGHMHLDLSSFNQFEPMTMSMSLASGGLSPMGTDFSRMSSMPFGPMQNADDLMADLSLPDLSQLRDWNIRDDLGL